MDLVIKNGTIVTATETYQADIGIEDGVIALIGQPPLPPPQSWGGKRGGEVIDATGKYVMPGGVDVHVHLQMTIGDGSAELAEAITSSDDFTTGTIAAACGGTTTIIDFIDPQPGQSLHQAVADRRSQADGCTAIDYGLHLTATNARPEPLAEIKELAAAGYTSLKLYTTYPALMVNDAEMLDLMAVAANSGVLPIVHTENHWMIEYLKKKLLAEGKTEPRYHPRSRPPLAEAEAANRVLTLAQLTACPVYLAHLTCRESLEVVRRTQAQGQRVYGEVCTQHLILSEDEYERPGFEAAKFVLSPPLRNKSNWEPLWNALATGTLQAISTDHCPWMFATHKQRGRDNFTQIPNGTPGIETRVPLIHHFGVYQGRLSINKFVELVSTAPARLFGLWPRKGTIAVGSDADIVIFDPQEERTLTKENLHMNVDYSPYEHITVRGYPVMTIARGRVIVKDNEFVGQVGAGQFLERKPFSKEQESKATRQRGNEATSFPCSPAPLRPCSSAPLLPCSPALLTWAEIDLDAIAHNTRELKRRVGEKTELMAVVKANGYGHGAVPVAETALDNGASSLAVHRTLEGVQLRQAGITAPVLIMGYTLPSEAETIVRWDLTPTVNTLEQANALSAAVSHPPFIPANPSTLLRAGFGGERGGALPIHVKVDTGLGRFGLLPDEVVDFVQAISELPGLILEGLYTHFAVADAADKAYTLQQFEIYLEVVKRLEEAGFTIPIRHVACSAAALDLPQTHLDMVRCGIALYGLRPSNEVEPTIPLRPAMALKSRVVRVRTLPAGSSISYGCTYTTTEPTRVALVPVGYGDGYHRLISNRGQVLIRGQRAPIVGRVCMDQFVVRVSHIPNVQQDDEVVLLGQQGDDEISAEEVATWAETINYEVTTSLLPRVTRVYLKDGQVVAVRSLIETTQQSPFDKKQGAVYNLSYPIFSESGRPDMPGSQVSLVIMTGAGGDSEVERMVALARKAITLDTVERALAVEAIGHIVVATDSVSLAESLRGKAVHIELGVPGKEFHFGRRLRELITQQGMEKVFYIGGGSSALLSSEDLGRIAGTLLSADELVIANNFYSTDFAAFSPAQVIKSIEPPAVDNDLAWRLVEQAGLPCNELPRSAATQLDVDTPTDLMTLKPHPGVGPHTRRYLDSLELDTSHIEQALEFFTDRDAEVLVAGRVSASTWAYLERETACRVRLFAEERGMRASGRQARGEAVSLLGFYLEEVELERFFITLGKMSQAAFLDSRVLFAHRHIWPSAADRFYSDLRQPQKIGDPWVRRFTEAAIAAPIPVVLGGHSLVSGGLYALVEAAWARGEDLARHVEPLKH